MVGSQRRLSGSTAINCSNFPCNPAAAAAQIPCSPHASCHDTCRRLHLLPLRLPPECGWGSRNFAQCVVHHLEQRLLPSSAMSALLLEGRHPLRANPTRQPTTLLARKPAQRTSGSLPRQTECTLRCGSGGTRQSLCRTACKDTRCSRSTARQQGSITAGSQAAHALLPQSRTM